MKKGELHNLKKFYKGILPEEVLSTMEDDYNSLVEKQEQEIKEIKEVAKGNLSSRLNFSKK